MEKVFVYGTLLKGEYNNRHLETSTLLGSSEVKGFEMRSLGPFPACFHSDLDSKVIGEVWEIDAETFARLDRLEGYPRFYDRVEVETPFGNAWMYIQWGDHCEEFELVKSGSWREHLTEKRSKHENH